MAFFCVFGSPFFSVSLFSFSFFFFIYSTVVTSVIDCIRQERTFVFVYYRDWRCSVQNTSGHQRSSTDVGINRCCSDWLRDWHQLWSTTKQKRENRLGKEEARFDPYRWCCTDYDQTGLAKNTTVWLCVFT